MKKRYDLNVFDEGATQSVENPGVGTPAGGAQAPAEAARTPGGYSYAQAEEIATARAQKAERAALASYFKQQGLSEDEVTKAIEAYKAAQKAKEPDVAALTRERDEALAKVAAHEQSDTLTKKGVKPDFAEFVAFKVRELMAKDDKLDTFEKAADRFLKDNPHYASGKPAYKVRTSSDAGSGSGQSKGVGGDKAAAHAALNAAIKAQARRK